MMPSVSHARLARVAFRALLLAMFPARVAVAHAQDNTLLGRDRMAALPADERAAWRLYLDTSAHYAALDRAALNAELTASGRTRSTPAPPGAVLVLNDSHTHEWFGSAAAQRIADAMISFQTPAGGWSKRIDYGGGPRQPGMSYASTDGWGYIGTFDNDATTEQLRFLARTYHAAPDERYRSAYLKGIEYVLLAQFPNGCWPQIFPLQGGYHDAVTFNDDALIRVLDLLREVVAETADLAPAGLRSRSGAALARGIQCIVRSQVVVRGTKTVWGAQHDPISLDPVQARAYEHASLSGAESAGVMRFLMQIDTPAAAVIEAVHAAAAWFRAHAIHDVEYEMKDGLVRALGAGPFWARFYELGTNRPIFSNRDGVVLYDFHRLDEERRLGYAWFSDRPAAALRAYERWARRHPLESPRHPDLLRFQQRRP